MKSLLGCLLLCSIGAYAEQETHELPPIQGWWPQQSFSSLASGVVQPQVMNGMIAYGTNWSMVSHAQMAAAQAAGKQAAKKACIDDAKKMNNDAYDDASQRWTDETADCHLLFANEPSALAVCTEDAGYRHDSSIESQDELLEIRKENCSKLYGS